MCVFRVRCSILKEVKRASHLVLLLSTPWGGGQNMQPPHFQEDWS